jgi:NAD(P)-dependent dehydrogenase (short-subunit alcohol dehydrogenase family)
MNKNKEGGVALVTGASRGIGRATAVLLAKAGMRVVATARSEDDLKSLRGEIEGAGGTVTIAPGDATCQSDVERVVATAMNAYGRIDVLVNNAGIGILGRLVDTPVEDFDRQVAANLRSVFLYSRLTVPHLIAGGGGNLVNIASISGLKGFAGASTYVATKFAVIGLSRSLDIELGPLGVKVTAICPAGVDTDWAIGTGLKREDVAKVDRLRPETIAEAVLYAIAQPANARVTELVIYPMSEGGHQ